MPGGAVTAGCGVGGAELDPSDAVIASLESVADFPSDMVATGMVAPITLESAIPEPEAIAIATNEHGLA